MFKHLSVQEREVILQRRAEARSPEQIAEELGRAPSTIRRELARNGDPNGYSAVAAQARYETRRRDRPRWRKMENPVISAYVRQRLTHYWSPDQIAGRVRVDFPADSRRQISHETIYTWIEADEYRDHWRSFLRREGKRRRCEENRGRLPAVVSIEGRPKVVNERKRYGDWEGDTVVGRAHRGGLLTTVERKSGYACVAKVLNLRAATINRAARRKLGALPAELRRTMTFDNGKEFANHQSLARHLGLRVFFAKPYKAWQRGTNENTNGLLRQFFPKGTDFAEVSHHEVACVETLLNERPRKRLGYKTPSEVLAEQCPRAFET